MSSKAKFSDNGAVDPASDPGETDLAALRAGIDRIDESLHDLIMERAALAERIGRAKNGEAARTALRPAREASILRRLLKRHAGPMPPAVLARLWREMMSAMVGVQGAFSLAVYMPQRGAGYLALAHGQYGSYTRAVSFRSVGQVVQAVMEGKAVVGILPIIGGEDETPWWPRLLGDLPETPKIVARLPFIAGAAGPGEDEAAFAISRVPFEPSGEDRSILAIETETRPSMGALKAMLESAGFTVHAIYDCRAIDAGHVHAVEVAGYFPPGHGTLSAHVADLGKPVTRIVGLGVYATPVQIG